MLTLLNPDLRDFLVKLNNISFGEVAYQLRTKEGWDLDLVNKEINRYRQFLILHRLYPERPLVPSRNVDTVWHHHVLLTELYRKNCEEVFGYYVNHYPSFGTRDGEDTEAAETAFAETCRLMDKHFTSQ